MADPIYMPLFNNNDLMAKIISVVPVKGQKISKGDKIFEVQTTKAAVEIFAEKDGFVIQICCGVAEEIEAGKVIMWIGDSPDESSPVCAEIANEPFVKKKGSLKEKITALRQLKEKEQVFIARNNSIEGDERRLTQFERGMRDSVIWQKQHAVSTYLEIVFDRSDWQEHAALVQKEHNLLLNPLLGLMGYRLVQLAKRNPEINAVLREDMKVTFLPVNLGFTIQVKDELFLVVVREAHQLGEKEFLDKLSDLQRNAFAGKLTQEEISGATICFTSLAKWGVSRHIPVLAPETAMIVAYSSPDIDLISGVKGTISVLGASYDHRILSGNKVASILNNLVNFRK